MFDLSIGFELFDKNSEKNLNNKNKKMRLTKQVVLCIFTHFE